MVSPRDLLAPLDTFERRHTGSAPADVTAMLQTVGYESLDALTDAAVPAKIRLKHPLRLPDAAVRYREEWFPTAEWVEIEGAGHCPQLDHPTELAELIAGFSV